MKQLIIVGIAVVVLGAGLWLFVGKSTSNQATNETGVMVGDTQSSPENTSDEIKTSGLGSFADLIGLGNNIRCDYKSTVEGQVSEGTFYTDGERFRVDATYRGAEGVIASNMINDGDFVYTWGDSPGGQMAFKMPMTESTVDTSPTPPSAPANESQVDMNEQVEYDCDRWNVDASVFVPPSDVEFMDMGSMMQEMQQGLPEGFEMPEGF